MARASYIVRLDDACPTMVPEPWAALETGLDALGICPLVAVIPECRDPKMMCAPADPGFWARVRRWQEKGWGIALHGLHHLYHPDPPGQRSLVPFKREGEFVGVDVQKQREMMRQAWSIFDVQGIAPDFFIAPSHSFDLATLEALRAETPIRRVSDGLSYKPFNWQGFAWYPQQLWHFRDMPFGLWTVNFHPNAMTSEDVDAAIIAVQDFADRIVAPASLPVPEGRDLGDILFEGAYRAAFALKRRRGRGG
jgi:hypothetical protein